MSPSRYLRRHRVALASVVVVIAAAASLVAYALASPGYPVRHVDLNDGGIWVTSDKDGLFGRLNVPAGKLDAGVSPPGDAQHDYALDIVQDGAAVAAWDRGTGAVTPIDVIHAKLADGEAKVGGDTQVVMAGGTLAVLDPASGKVWAIHEDPSAPLPDLTAVDSTSSKPLATVGAGAKERSRSSLAVGVDGTVYVVSPSGELVRIARTETGFGAPQRSSTGLSGAALQVTAVGEQPVVFDPATGKLSLGGGRTTSIDTDAQAQLQAPSAGRDAVVVATSKSLLSVPLDGRAPTTLFDGGTGSGQVAVPTWLANCVHAAWSGAQGVYARSCDGAQATRFVLDQPLRAPVFRVNRNAIVLNEPSSGAVWDLTAKPHQVADWSSVAPPPKDDPNDKDKNNTSANNAQDLPPKANDDSWGARPGRTTVVHVLDNDSDPQGYILSVQSVSAPTPASATLSIAPDGQTVEVTTPAQPVDVHFSYTIDDGKGLTATANVTVQARPEPQNAAPVTRLAYTQPTWTVVAGGRLSMPVLADWRDQDGDPLFLDGAKAPAGVGVTSSPDGRIDVVAPPSGAGDVEVDYGVSDGTTTSPGRVVVSVLAPTATTAVAAVAQADVGRGQVGQPIVIHPLDNDLPGADPTDPAATLLLAGQVTSSSGATVTTDLKAGTVTVLAQHAGVIPLTYSAAFGNAPFGTGKIRVDVTDAPATPQPPVAMPDTGVLFAQNPAIIDVLANDYDPAGGVLVVQHAAPIDDTSPVQVAIVSGHWLRVSASSAIAPGTAVVLQYTLADGVATASNGEVTLITAAMPADDTPVARDDVATVRAGDAVAVPVLDNDSSPAGSPLSLVPVVKSSDPNTDQPAGTLRTTTMDGKTGDIGTAFVAGNLVRYVPPASVTAPTTALVEYVAQTPDGRTATGHVRITVNPAPGQTNPNQPPSPQALEARVVAGDTVHITVPTTGIDSDGDSVAVTGIAVPAGGTPAGLGRITKISATTIDYQAFPAVGTGGTDTVTYQVSDRFGGTGQATIRVAVVPPGDPQPPVAVDDVVTAATGAKLSVDVLANDLRAPDDEVSIADLDTTNPDLVGGAALSGPQGPITVSAPEDPTKPTVVLYAISDGLGRPSIGKLTIRGVDGYDNPPFAVDAYAEPTDKNSSVTVDVRSQDGDVDGDPAALKITLLGDTKATQASVTGGKVTVTPGKAPLTIPYQVEDDHGAVASAVIHVPAAGSGAAPYVKVGQVIKVDQDATKTVDINDYVSSPGGKKLTLTLKERIWSAPVAGLEVAAVDGSTSQLTLTGLAGYVGPAAITVEVADGPLGGADTTTTVISVPVQVGPETPVLRCPSTPITAIEGGADVGLEITSLCHVWVADPTTRDSLPYTVTWKQQAAGVDILQSGSHRPSLRAGGSAVPGSSGVLSVGVDGTHAVASTLAVTIEAAPPPTIAPVVIDGFKASDTATVDLKGYVSSQLRDPRVHVVSVTHDSGMPATATSSGSTVQIKPGADSHGTIGYTVVATDVDDTARTDRRVTGHIVLNVLNVPDAPSAPVADRSVISHIVQLSWSTPAANGAPIDHYTVSWSGGQQECPASPCSIVNLTNGTQYTFAVSAHNAVGDGKASGASAPAQPNAVPDAVTNLVSSDPQDGRLTLTWTAAHVDGTPVQKYLVTWGNGGSLTVPGDATTASPSGLDNDSPYDFSVTPVNQLGPGPTAGVQGQSAGAPQPPTGLKAGSADVAGGDARAITLSWDVADPNGPGPTTYTVTRTGGGGGVRTLCASTQQSTCLDPNVTNDGTTYAYTVTAMNAAAAKAPLTHTSPASTPLSVEASAPPAGVSSLVASPSGVDGQADITFDVGPSHGTKSIVHCTVEGRSCGDWDMGSTGAVRGVRRSVDGLTNGASTQITLVQDNGSSNTKDTGSNTSSPASVTVTSFGQYSGLSMELTRNEGPTITYVVHANPNGRALSLHIVGTAHDSTIVTSSTSGTWTSPEFSDTIGFGNAEDIRVDATDTAGPAPRPETSSSSYHWGTHDAPTLSVSPGAYGNASYCTSSGCRQIVVAIRNFTPNGTVTLWYDTDCAGINPTSCTGGAGGGMTHYTSEVYSLDSNGDADISDRYFGYTGSRVWVDADVYGGHYESNHSQF